MKAYFTKKTFSFNFLPAITLWRYVGDWTLVISWLRFCISFKPNNR